MAMRRFMDRDFLLTTKTAKEIYRKGAEKTPIFDWHCHLSAKEIYENKRPKDITELWLSSDHYKWRMMRSCGVGEMFITGKKSSHDKFMAYAKSLPKCIGNPLYTWTHLELQRYFNIETPLSEKTAEEIYKRCNEQIRTGDFRPQALIQKSNVTCVCTTDDPADDLTYHELLAKEADFSCKVLPAFRADKAIHIESSTFIPWVAAMEKAVRREIHTFADLKTALLERLDYFCKHGACACDQSVLYVPYRVAPQEKIEKIFKKGLSGAYISLEEIEEYITAMLLFLGEAYAKRNMVMELHIGPMRNNNSRMFARLGADAGFDSIGDRNIAEGLSRYLNALEEKNSLPKTVLFALNPKDNYVIGSMLGNFQSGEAASKIQFGSAWWFNDNYDGMRAQMKALANLGSLGCFIGMVTDSRSFLSYPRHEYFRRILCELLGEFVEEGKYPYDVETLSKMVEDISYNNALAYFGLEIQP